MYEATDKTVGLYISPIPPMVSGLLPVVSLLQCTQ